MEGILANFRRKITKNVDFHVRKILKQVEYESARRNKHINKKQEKERNKSQHSLLSHLFLTTQAISKELKGTRGFLKGSN